MSLLEEMIQKRKEETILNQEELTEVLENTKKFFFEWQEACIDRRNFVAEVDWCNNRLTLIPKDEFCCEEKEVTREVKSKQKQRNILEQQKG